MRLDDLYNYSLVMLRNGLSSAGWDALCGRFKANTTDIMLACWQNGYWNTPQLQITTGGQLRIINPGIVDGQFLREAQIEIDGEIMVGNIGFIADASTDTFESMATANDVILLVVLSFSGQSAVPVFNLSVHVSLEIRNMLLCPPRILERNIPGLCGLQAVLGGHSNLLRFINNAAKVRMQAKKNLLNVAIDDQQLLYECLLQTMGIKKYKEVFRDLARTVSYASIQPFIAQPIFTARREILSRWFGCLGILNNAQKDDFVSDEHRIEYFDFRHRWQESGLADFRAPEPSRSNIRPINWPERRLVGTFYMLYALGSDGLIKGWLSALHRMHNLHKHQQSSNGFWSVLDSIFLNNRYELWNNSISYSHSFKSKDYRLIGHERIIVLIANAIIPFYLSYAEKIGDRGLEELLYELFLVLPPENLNSRTKYMQTRITASILPQRTLSTEQGLLQIEQDHCQHFSNGCQDCQMIDLMTNMAAD